MPTPCTEPFPDSFLGDCEQACDIAGHKGIVARKVWHGRLGFDREAGCTTDTYPVPARDQVHYLTKSIEVLINSSAGSSDDVWVNWSNDIPGQIHCTDSQEFVHEREAVGTVGRYSGVETQTSCRDDRTDPVQNCICDPPQYTCGTPANPLFQDIQCVAGEDVFYRSMADIFGSLNACNGIIAPEVGMGGCPQNDGQYSGTPAEIEAYWTRNETTHSECNGVDFYGSGDVLGTSDTTITSECHVSLSATVIEISITVSTTTVTHSFMQSDTLAPTGYCIGFKVNAGKPTTSSYSASGTLRAIISLSGPYTNADVNNDVEDLLDLRSLNSDPAEYDWQNDVDCQYPYIFYDEVPEGVEPLAWHSGECGSYIDPNALAPNGYYLNGFTGDVINGTGNVIISHDNNGVMDGAYKYNDASHRVLWATKYAEVLSPRPGHNFYRPCGDDRNLRSNLFWTVTDASNTAPIEITTNDPDDTVRTGDRVFIGGVAGNTAANEKHWPVIRTGVSKFTLTGSAGTGAYEGPSGVAQLMRFPTAWPICGHLDVSAASSDTPVLVETGENFLIDRDKVAIAGVGTVADGDYYVKVVSSTTFELYDDADLTTATAPTGAYTASGTVKNTDQGALTVPSESWNTDASRGDFVVLFFAYDLREVALTPTIRQYNPTCYSVEQALRHMSGPAGGDTITQGNLPGAGGPKVVCISPNGEDFGADSVTYPFPAVAMPLVIDERFGARWCGQVRQRMDNPINQVNLSDYVETRITAPVGAPTIPEARGGARGNSNPYGISGILILNIPEVTALAVAGCPPAPIAVDPNPPGLPAKIEYVNGVCVAFDDDAGLH